jgi:hypothetical protein
MVLAEKIFQGFSHYTKTCNSDFHDWSPSWHQWPSPLVYDFNIYDYALSIYPPCEIGQFFNLPYVRKLSFKSKLFRLSGSREDFYMATTPFLYFSDYLPFEEDSTLYLNKLKFPLAFTQRWFVPSLIEIGWWFWRRFKLKNFNVFLLYRYYLYLPFEKGAALHLLNFVSPSPQGWFL